jgi:hypothetical protein
MNANDQALLEELKASLKHKHDKTLVEAYLRESTPEGLIKSLLATLERAADETE